jgi:NAD dependent epimerase/dehydratase
MAPIENVLVTGAGGFIGSHLVERCVELGYRVRAFVRYNSTGNWGWLDGSKHRDAIEIVAGDIREFDAVARVVKGVDTVFHLAALIGIPYSYRSPLAYIRTNVEGTYNVLQAALESSVSNVLVTSTSEIYGTAQYVPMDESHPAVGQSPYSATKIAADHLALSFFRSFDLPVKLVRPFNTYGPRQSARAIIPTMITQALDGRRSIKVGNLVPTRDLTYVLDTVEGFIEIARSAELFGEATNIGMGQEISVGDLAHLVSRALGVDLDITVEKERVRPPRSEVERLLCDNSKLLQRTGWSPKYRLEAGLAETIEWFRAHRGIYKADQYVV